VGLGFFSSFLPFFWVFGIPPHIPNINLCQVVSWNPMIVIFVALSICNLSIQQRVCISDVLMHLFCTISIESKETLDLGMWPICAVFLVDINILCEHMAFVFRVSSEHRSKGKVYPRTGHEDPVGE
jgi:hypothetical protein